MGDSNVTYSNSWSEWPPMTLANRQAQAAAQAAAKAQQFKQFQQAQLAQLAQQSSSWLAGVGAQQYQAALPDYAAILGEQKKPPAPKYDAKDDYNDEWFFEPRE